MKDKAQKMKAEKIMKRIIIVLKIVENVLLKGIYLLRLMIYDKNKSLMNINSIKLLNELKIFSFISPLSCF